MIEGVLIEGVLIEGVLKEGVLIVCPDKRVLVRVS